MKKSFQLSAVLAVISSIAQAENTQTQKALVVPPLKAAQPIEQKVSGAVRLSDAELDKITAAKATHETGHGTTIVFNPGNANLLIRHKRGATCINCF
jgi:hypothetical protein